MSASKTPPKNNAALSLESDAPASPFATYRDLAMGRNSTGVALGDIVLSCWSQAHTSGLHKLTAMDPNYRRAAFEMMEHFAKHGEGDPAFMSLANDILAAREKQRAELERERAELDRESTDDDTQF